MSTATVLLILFLAIACIFCVWLLVIIWPVLDKEKAKAQVDDKLARWAAYWKAKFAGPKG